MHCTKPSRGVQAVFRRRRHQPRRPPHAAISTGGPEAAIGPGTLLSVQLRNVVWTGDPRDTRPNPQPDFRTGAIERLPASHFTISASAFTVVVRV